VVAGTGQYTRHRRTVVDVLRPLRHLRTEDTCTQDGTTIGQAMTNFATELTRLMKERDVSVRALAQQSGYSKSHISQLKLGQRNPSPEVAEDLDDALEADGTLKATAPGQRSRPSQDRTIGRSDFLVLTGTVVVLLDVLKGELPARIAASSAGRARMDDETAEGLASVILGYRQVYRSAAPSSLLDPVCGAIRLLADLAPAAGQHRDRIVSLIGQASSLAGIILMLDQSDFEGATRYLSIATRAARQSGDDELLGINLAVRAFHSCYGGDPADGLAFAVEAQRVAGSTVHPLSRGWINAVASEMYATTGDQSGFERALAAAQDFIEAPDPGKPWEGIGAFSAGKLTAYQGGGLLRLGKVRGCSDSAPRGS